MADPENGVRGIPITYFLVTNTFTEGCTNLPQEAEGLYKYFYGNLSSHL